MCQDNKEEKLDTKSKGKKEPTWDEIRYKVFYRDQGNCQYCGIDLATSYSAHGTFQADHLIPQSIEGGDEWENLRLACASCNVLLSSLDRDIKKIKKDEWLKLSHGERFKRRFDYVQSKLNTDKLKWMPDVQIKVLVARAMKGDGVIPSVHRMQIADKIVSVIKTASDEFRVVGWIGSDEKFEKLRENINKDFGVTIRRE